MRLNLPSSLFPEVYVSTDSKSTRLMLLYPDTKSILAFLALDRAPNPSILLSGSGCVLALLNFCLNSATWSKCPSNDTALNIPVFGFLELLPMAKTHRVSWDISIYRTLTNSHPVPFLSILSSLLSTDFTTLSVSLADVLVQKLKILCLVLAS